MIAVRSTEPRYPRRLRDLASPPAQVWIAGDAELLEAPTAITVVGTRRMSPYGERVAHDLGRLLARAGVLVVSGLAQGIDSAAHAGALDADGRTVAVLGEGIDSYLRDTGGPRRRLAARMLGSGALLSQYPPDARAMGWMFARRNETMAALGDAVVVVEAPEGSGALITAEAADQIGRPVHAVPGPIGTRASRGSNELIAVGRARPLVDIAGFVAQLGVGAVEPAPSTADPLLELLACGPMQPDLVAAALALSPQALAADVLRLVLDGRLVQTPDGRLALAARTS